MKRVAIVGAVAVSVALLVVPLASGGAGSDLAIIMLVVIGAMLLISLALFALYFGPHWVHSRLRRRGAPPDVALPKKRLEQTSVSSNGSDVVWRKYDGT